jgi:SWI/SNF-related matrix-associated actin-dependent regulator 1 of chromatin subfamily A
MEKSKFSIITKNNNKRFIKLPFIPDKEEIKSLKTFVNYKLNSSGFWLLPLSFRNAKKLISFGFAPDEIALKYVKGWEIKKENLTCKNLVIPGLLGELRPYQKVGVKAIDNFNGVALLADDMGLGKTPQSIAYCQMYREKLPVIIICPSFLKENWRRHLIHWMSPEPNIQILEGFYKPEKIITGDYIILNYDIVSNRYKAIKDKEGRKQFKENKGSGWVDHLIKINPQIIISDECHYWANNSAYRTKAVKKLVRKIPHKIYCSGTPFESSPKQLWNAINSLNPYLFSNFFSFTLRYCNAFQDTYGFWNRDGSSNELELNKKLREHIMIRRLKSDVLTDLPEKTYSFIPLEINNRKEYSEAEQDFLKWIEKDFRDNIKEIETELTKKHGLKITVDEEETKELLDNKLDKAASAEGLQRLNVLTKVAVKGKMDDCIKWIKNFLESGEKLVVFYIHKSVSERLMKEFGKVAVLVDGTVLTRKRQTIVDRFQPDPKIKLFVGQTVAAGIGWDLTAAYNVAIIELPDTPGKLRQEIDRLHRIGQVMPIMVWYLVAINTFEEKRAKQLDKRQRQLDLIMDGKDTSEQDMIFELLKKSLKK